MLMVGFLHHELALFAKREITFEELYYHMNNLIESKGFVSLDFSGNLGHSIARNKEGRIYIEKDNLARLVSAAFLLLNRILA